jgi:multidrug efflux pump subunit AcrB
LIPVALAVLLFTNGIRQKFFPAAERNQFVVELWMPTGTQLSKTEQSILKIQNIVQKDKRVTSFATFIGTSAPRFYYNFDPEFPVTNYAQILINTTTEETTLSLSEELAEKLDKVVPEGTPQVKLMQQGPSLKAPVEVRIVGDDINVLKRLGAQVEGVVKNTKGSLLVHNDYREDYYGVDIRMKEEAERLGFTTESISKMVYTGFSGAPVTTMYEGDNPIDIVFRFDENQRHSTNDLLDMYVSSPVTAANVQLRQIADINTEWHTGRIVHRNGVRTLTVRSETTSGVLPSELLKAIQPQISKIPLPTGYSINYGGEDENQNDTFPEMVSALMISAPQNAGQKPRISKPGTMAEVSQRQSAFRMKRNRPSVTSVSGSVSTRRTGRTIALIKPRTSAATMTVTVPPASMPGTTSVASQIATALTSARIRKPIACSPSRMSRKARGAPPVCTHSEPARRERLARGARQGRGC